MRAADHLNQLRSVMLYDSTLKMQPSPTPMQHQTQMPTHSSVQSVQSVPAPTQSAPTQSVQSVQSVPVKAPAPVPSFRPALNQDPLFWCFYVMKYGAFKYEQIANRFTAEQDCKRDEIMRLRETGKQLKQSTGIKFTMSGMEGDLMSNRISLHAFQVLACLNSLNAIFVHPANQVYAEFIHDAVSSKPVFVVERANKQMTMTQATEAQLTAIRATHYRIENPQKPVKSASAYTVADLTELCHQLKIQLGTKMKKQELYDAVAQKLVL